MGYSVRNMTTRQRFSGSLASAIGACLALCTVASAQEALDTLLERGFVAHWLVCGPFRPDIEGGIAAAARDGRAPLGDRDFLEAVGGAARVRPRHLLEVRGDEGKKLWMRAGANDANLDLAPFFPDDSEGIAYAAFYAQSDTERNVFLQLHSTLGARIWLNSFLLRDVRPAPLNAVGVDRFVAAFRPGANLVLIEVAGAKLDALAEALGVGTNELLTGALRNRTLLRSGTGFEIALTLAPVERLGSMAYVPRLTAAGTFSGGKDSLRQDMLLTLLNPAGVPSPEVRVQAEVRGGPSIEATEPPLPPDEERQVRLAIPIAGVETGTVVSVKVSLAAADANASFPAQVVVQPPNEGGRVFVITGQRLAAEETGDQAALTEKQLISFKRQAALLSQEPDYGFDLGDVSRWGAGIAAFPDTLPALREAVRTGRCATRAGFAPLDERLVCEETLVRNLALGIASGRAFLGDAWQTYYAWDTPAIAPQTPQILAQAGVPGMISNAPYGGMPALFQHAALDGTTRLHRHKQTAAGPATLDALRQMASLQRRALLDDGFASDVLVIESALTPPEPFYLGACTELTRSFPAVVPRGAGARDFFDEVTAQGQDRLVALPVSGRLFTAMRPGELLSQPELKQMYNDTEARLLTAEKAATFAALAGADYPGRSLDYAWRQLLYWGTPDRLGFLDDGRTVCDMLAGLHEAAAAVEDVRAKSLDYLARQAETLSGAPSPAAGARVLFVFNPSARPRTDVCTLSVAWSTAEGIEVINDRGDAVPFLIDRHERAGERLVTTRLRFVAADVPALGYRSFYLVARKNAPVPSRRADAQIENGRWLLIADTKTGAIRSLVEKATGTEYAKGNLNRPVLLGEDTARTASGRECWTNGDSSFADAAPSKIEAVIADGTQELTITSPFGGGTLTRRITLYRDVDRIDCETSFENVALDGRMLGIAFALEMANRVPVFGERFGAVAGRVGETAFEYRSAGADNPSLTGAQPLMHWMALSANDHLQVGLDGCVPLRPASVVHGADPALEEAARMLARALTQRGIPASIMADEPEPREGLWNDATTFVSFEDEAAHGIGTRISIGAPEQNALTRRLFEKLPEDARNEALERFKQGAALFVMDEDAATGVSPVPTLILGGSTPNQSANAARECAEAIAGRGVYALPPTAYIGETPPRTPETGLALLRPGASLGSVEPDGTMVLLLAHQSRTAQNEDLIPNIKKLTVRYAILPIQGGWRGANVPSEAHAFNEPLVATVTDPHAGRLPAAQSFLETSDAGFVVTAVKPGGYPVGITRESPHPRNGIAVRGYAAGGAWDGTLRLFTPLRRAVLANGLEEPGDPLQFTDRQWAASVPAFAVRTFWLLPSLQFATGTPEPLQAPEAIEAPVYTRYWRHNAGVAPPGTERLSLTLHGNLEDTAAPIRLLVGNPTVDQTLEGVVYLSATQGWSAAPSQVYFGLRPGEFKDAETVILRDSGAQGGGIAAWTKIGERTYRDTLIEDAKPIALDLKRTGNQIRATVGNPNGVPLEGFAELITLPDFWLEQAASGAAAVAPRRTAVSVGAFQSRDVVFRCPEAAVAAGAVVRLLADGNVIYRKVE